MKKYYFLIAIAITGTLFIISCKGGNEIAEPPTYSRQEVVDLILADPESRLTIWSKIDTENKYQIWKDKISQICAEDLKPEWRTLFAELEENFTFENYLDGLGSPTHQTYLSHWGDRFFAIANEEERSATIGSLYDYSSFTNSISSQIIDKMIKYSQEQKETRPRITNRDRPFEDEDCDCRWTDCDLSGQYCCKPQKTTGCNETSSGCGLIWLQSCNSFCVDGYAYDCDDF